MMRRLKKKIKTMAVRLRAFLRGWDSLIKLTDRGKTIVKEVQPDRWIGTYAEELLPRTRGKSVYHIQALALRFAEKTLPQKLEAPVVKEIEASAARHGVAVEEVMKVIGVVLRDKLFQRIHSQRTATHVSAGPC